MIQILILLLRIGGIFLFIFIFYLSPNKFAIILMTLKKLFNSLVSTITLSFLSFKKSIYLIKIIVGLLLGTENPQQFLKFFLLFILFRPTITFDLIILSKITKRLDAPLSC